MNRDLTGQMGYLFIGKAGALIFTFLIPVLLVRALSVEDYGAYKQIFLLSGTLMIFLRFGLEASLYYFLPRDPEEKNTFISQTIVFYVVIGAVSVLLSFFFDTRLATLIGNATLAKMIPLILLCTVLMLVSDPMEAIMISLKQARIASTVIFSSEALKAFFLVCPAIIFGSILPILWGAILHGVCRLILLSLYLFRWIGISIRRVSAKVFIRQLRYSFPFWLATIFAALADTIHFYLISYLFGASSFAVYSVGFAHIAVSSVLFETVVGTSMVRLAEYAKNGNSAAVAFIISNVTKKLFIVFLPLFCFFFLCSREFILLLYTAKFEASTPVFEISLLMLPISSFNLSYALRSFGNTTYILVICIVRLTLTASLVIFLSSHLQLIGAAIGVVAAHFLSNGLLLVKAMKVTRLSLGEIFPPKPLIQIFLTATAASVFATILKIRLEVSPALLLVYAFMAFASVYVVFIHRFHLVDDELALLRGFGRRILR